MQQRRRKREEKRQDQFKFGCTSVVWKERTARSSRSKAAESDGDLIDLCKLQYEESGERREEGRERERWTGRQKATVSYENSTAESSQVVHSHSHAVYARQRDAHAARHRCASAARLAVLDARCRDVPRAGRAEQGRPTKQGQGSGGAEEKAGDAARCAHVFVEVLGSVVSSLVTGARGARGRSKEEEKDMALRGRAVSRVQGMSA